MFSFFKRLIGKSADTDKPEDPPAEDAPEVKVPERHIEGFEPEALPHDGTAGSASRPTLRKRAIR